MATLTSTGYTCFVCVQATKPADAAAYAALTWTEVKHVTSIPSYGAQRAVVTYQPLADGYDIKDHGFANYGSVAIEGASDNADAGQAIVKSAVETLGTNLAIKLVDRNGDIDYCWGKAFSKNKTPGGANSMVMTSMTVEFNAPVITVTA